MYLLVVEARELRAADIGGSFTKKTKNNQK